jgi:Arc/MetJ family transcription regulator
MRTTLELDEKLIEELLKVTGAKSKKEAITKAVEDYLRRQCVEEIKKMRGKLQFDMTWEEMEEIELAEYKDDH